MLLHLGVQVCVACPHRGDGGTQVARAAVVRPALAAAVHCRRRRVRRAVHRRSHRAEHAAVLCDLLAPLGAQCCLAGCADLAEGPSCARVADHPLSTAQSTLRRGARRAAHAKWALRGCAATGTQDRVPRAPRQGVHSGLASARGHTSRGQKWAKGRAWHAARRRRPRAMRAALGACTPRLRPCPPSARCRAAGSGW